MTMHSCARPYNNLHSHICLFVCLLSFIFVVVVVVVVVVNSFVFVFVSVFVLFCFFLFCFCFLEDQDVRLWEIYPRIDLYI